VEGSQVLQAVQCIYPLQESDGSKDRLLHIYNTVVQLDLVQLTGAWATRKKGRCQAGLVPV
jgi:hypothetical protein